MRITDKVGILDPDGLKKNPLNDEEYSEDYKKFSKIWSKQPMYNSTEYPPIKIIKMIRDNQVIIIEAGTGQGKTLLVPKYCLHALHYDGKVITTNPKRVPTKENAIFSAQCSDVELGKEIGYKYKDSKKENRNKKTNSDETKLLYATDGTLAQILRSDETCSEYDIVLIDEAHERNMSIDNIIYRMRIALRLNPKLKLVIMSATLPGNLFKDYFKEFKMDYVNLPAIPSKPVEVHYLEKSVNFFNIEDCSIEILFTEIIEKRKVGDVLIFAPSFNSAKKLCEKIRERAKATEKLKCYPIAGQGGGEKEENLVTLVTDENKYKDEPGGPWKRKIVTATNALESSITIDNLKYVIDSGIAYVNEWDPLKMKYSMKIQWIAQDAMKQRKGRVGRTSPGECWRVYTEKRYNEVPEFTEVAIKKENISGEFMSRFQDKDIFYIKDIRNIFENYLESPPKDSIECAIDEIFKYKLVTSKEDDGILTDKGKKVNLFLKSTNNNLNVAILLATSLDYDNLWDACTMSSIIITLLEGKKSIMMQDEETKRKKDYSKKKQFFCHVGGDLLSYYQMFHFFYKNVKKMNISELKELCNKNYLNFNVLRDIRETHLKLWRETSQFKEYKNPEVKKYDEYTNMLICLLESYNTNIAKKIDTNNYINWYPRIKSIGKIDKDSFLKSSPEYIIYINLTDFNNKNSFQICTKITKTQMNILNKKLDLGVRFPERTSSKKKNSPKKKKK